MKDAFDEPVPLGRWARDAVSGERLKPSYLRMRALELLLELVEEGLATPGPVNALGEPTFALTEEARCVFRERFWDD